MRCSVVLLACAAFSLPHAGAFAPVSSVQPAFAPPLALPRLAMAPRCTHRRVAGGGVVVGGRVAAGGRDASFLRMGAAAAREDPAAREIKNFLTQRAAQTLIFILETGRDEITADWLEDFKNHTGFKRYHGYGALKLDWDDYVSGLLREPPATVVVQMKRRGNGVGGWSKNNPYLQDHVYEYEEDIEPRKLAARLMILREEIAKEWQDDLALITRENDEVWRSFFEKAREKGVDALINMQLPSDVFAHDVNHGGTLYRGGSYDLLKRLSTLRASEKMMRSFKTSSKSVEGGVKAEWLERMMTVYGAEFEGDAGYAVDRKFLESLLSSSPKLITKEGSGETVMLSPVGIVEELLQERANIAAMWSSYITDIVGDHTEIQRALLTDTAV